MSPREPCAPGICARISLSVMTWFACISNVPGLLRNFPDEASLIREIPARDVESFMAFAKDRMKKKVLGAAEAVEGGVERVIFGDARLEKPVSRALEGQGTVVS